LKDGQFYSRGKFLLSAEYLVLQGAKALAVPLKFGQSMKAKKTASPGILNWETYIREELWFSARFSMRTFEIVESTDDKTAGFISEILDAAAKIKPEIRSSVQGYQIRTDIDFDINWGLGSSSSLLSNLAYWFGIDPYMLFKSIFEGSGYDIFCARASQPIFYQLVSAHPIVQQADFHPSFSSHLFFIYRGSKQDSQQSVRNFKTQYFADEKRIQEISELTENMALSYSVNEFLELMNRHEEIISSLLARKTVKEELFPDFQGEIKSLGAWGGDFIMAGTLLDPVYIKDYFHSKGFPVIFNWEEIVY
jgi:mevalonate kinase